MTEPPQPRDSAKPPAGYYPDSSGVSRYWDGNAWTEQTQQAPASAPINAPPGAAAGGVATAANPRADAKAAKAYAKASRPWYRKKRWWLLGVVLLIIIIAASSSGGGSGDGSSAKPSVTSSDTKKDAGSNSGETSSAKPSAFGSSKLPQQNGDWRLDSISVKDDGLGDLGGTARITYTGDNPDGGDNIFTVTLFKGKETVGSLQGSANTVKPGRTVTVQFISTDKFVKGPYKYDFQNDL